MGGWISDGALKPNDGDARLLSVYSSFVFPGSDEGTLPARAFGEDWVERPPSSVRDCFAVGQAIGEVIASGW